MSAASDTTQRGRRRFLKGVMAVGGTTVLVAVGREAMVDDEPQEVVSQTPSQADTQQGYHVTAHIESYYDKARF